MTEPVFFPPSRTCTAGEVAALVGALLRDSSMSGAKLSKISPLSEGGSDALVYAEGLKQKNAVRDLSAAAILCPEALAEHVPTGVAVLISQNPRTDFAAIGRLLFPSAVKPGALTGETGVSASAHVSSNAVIEPGAIIEPGAVVSGGASVGAGSVIAPNAVIGPGVQIGRDCFIGPGATVIAAFLGNGVIIHTGVRIGQDGFGYVPGSAGLEKQPQIGRVIIQNNVEIGANSTIDRGAMEDTIVGEGTKIDNLVQIAHNVRIGRHCAIAAHCGISGSVTLGDFVMLGGRVGITDHVTIGDRVLLAAGSGVMHDVPAGARWGGAPAKPIKDFFREVAAVRSLAAVRKTKGQADE